MTDGRGENSQQALDHTLPVLLLQLSLQRGLVLGLLFPGVLLVDNFVLISFDLNLLSSSTPHSPRGPGCLLDEDTDGGGGVLLLLLRWLRRTSGALEQRGRRRPEYLEQSPDLPGDTSVMNQSIEVGTFPDCGLICEEYLNAKGKPCFDGKIQSGFSDDKYKRVKVKTRATGGEQNQLPE